MIVCTNYTGQTPTAYQNLGTTDPDIASTFVPASISRFFLTWFPNEIRLRCLCSPAALLFHHAFQTSWLVSAKSDHWRSPTRQYQDVEQDAQQLPPLSASKHPAYVCRLSWAEHWDGRAAGMRSFFFWRNFSFLWKKGSAEKPDFECCGSCYCSCRSEKRA